MKLEIYTLKRYGYLLVFATTMGLALLNAAAAVFPDVHVEGPPSNPNFPESFEVFDPPVSNMSVQANAPEIYEYTRDNNAGDTMIMSGGNFSLYTNQVSRNLVTVHSALLNDSYAATFTLMSTWTPETAIEFKCSAYNTPNNGDRLFYAEEGKKVASIYYMNGKWVAGDGVGGTIVLGDYDTGSHTFRYDSKSGIVSIDDESYSLSGVVDDPSKLYVACNSSGYQAYPMVLESVKVWREGVLMESLAPIVDGTFKDSVNGTVYKSKAFDPVRSLPLPFTVNADREVVVSGEGGWDSIFIVYGRGTTDSCPIIRLDRGDVAISLPESLPSDDVYMVWPGNQSGMGRPVVVNQTEAWWIGPDEVEAGRPFSIYGRNLGTNCYVYIEELDQWVESDSCNPYKADFVMPSNATVGTYSIWVHNTKGGRYGWARPLACYVKENFAWSGKIVDVTTYGATGNGTADDWPAISQAYAACSSGDTLYFPAGTYAMGYRFGSRTGIKFLGAGRNSTTIRPHITSTSGGILFDGKFADCLVEGLAFEAIGDADVQDQLFRWSGDGNTFKDCRFSSLAWGPDGYKTTPFNFINNTHLTLKDCEIINSSNPGNFTLGGGRQILIDGCAFRGANHCSIMIGAWGGQQISVINCTAAPYDNSETGHFDGRWFVTADYWGAVNNIYFGGNSSTNCAPPKIDGYHANTGEQILIEGGKFRVRGSVVAATSNTITVASTRNAESTKSIVTITSGKGYGQTRKVSSVDTNSNVITLAEKWRVVPDSDSTYVVSASTYRFVVFDNHFDGKEEWITGSEKSASTGVASFGGSIELIVDSNKMTDLRTGIYQWPLGGQEVGGIRSLQACFFNTFQNNSISGGCIALLNIVSESDENLLLDGGIYATTCRENIIDSMSSEGVAFSTSLPENLIRMSVFERNTANNCQIAINESPYLQNQLYIDNVGTNGNSGVAMAIAYDHLPALKGNVWTGYSVDYQKGPSIELPLETLLELPQRMVLVGSDAIASPKRFPVWNLAISPMAWTARSDSDWIVMDVDNGTVADQNDEGFLSFSIATNELPSSGSIKGTVVVTAGDQVKQMTVLYEEGAPSIVWVSESVVIYPLAGFEGATVRARLWDENRHEWRELGIMDSPTELVIENVLKGSWYRLLLEELNDSTDEWKKVYSCWFGR